MILHDEAYRKHFYWMVMQGICCGLETPAEWICSYDRCIGESYEKYAEIDEFINLVSKDLYECLTCGAESTKEQVNEWLDKSLNSPRINNEVKEICICSAVKATDGKYYRGHRHSDCIRTICERKIDDNGNMIDLKVDKEMRTNQGFITSRNRFVDRSEGYNLQIAAGIPSARGEYYGDTLFSEDLY